MVERVTNATVRWIELVLGMGFLALIMTVGLQVAARNVFRIPLIWTLDLAQLLFSWLIFIGAAMAFRRGVHYTVDIVPEGWATLSAVLRVIGILASAVVIYVLIRYGFVLVGIRQTGLIQSLGISRAWMFLPLPICGLLMLVFLIESTIRLIRKGPQ
ncbi:TRAP transporter small permease [Fodinicurvata sp. EGI_FJ10296]|uniref:TRAP transporter small permease n=1 Tax=Fodinicurvata sp. EGI_FJ10296 TaxID=3231908 RepID=UPI0034572F9D